MLKILLALFVLGSCGHSVPTKGAAPCPIDGQVQRDAKRIGNEANTVSVVKKTQDEFDTSLCSVEVRLTWTTGPQTNLQLQYERIEGNWKLREEKTVRSEQATDPMSQIRAFQHRMCACKDKACAKKTLAENRKFGDELFEQLGREGFQKLVSREEELEALASKFTECERNIPDEKGVTDNQRRAMWLKRTAEGVQGVRKIASAARHYYAQNGKLPEASVGPTPLKGCCASGGFCAPDASQWQSPAWQALNFSMAAPHQYTYQYATDASIPNFTAYAHGDLDCDGEYSSFSLYGEVIDGELQIAADVRKTDPHE